MRSKTHRKMRQSAEGRPGPWCGAAVEVTSALRNTVSQERVPAEWLSIYLLRSFHNLCESLAFPMYRAPVQLTAQAASQQLELHFLRRLLQLQLYALSQTNMQGQRMLLPALAQKTPTPVLTVLFHCTGPLRVNMREVKEELLQCLLLWVRELRRRTSQGLLYGAQTKIGISHWWKLTAQFVLPE
ncbi:hypothetical protein ANANG_G00123490 [Anguilla anguilla]|uniref:Uncharacterized protein n=1 Tax=Anguilla anguilla TaxID=7936 RepID=A0A9D3RXC8_ANGAN|nr:hypothetical protein ANANG_G00123490 [Anguilla anguilla]